MTKKKEIGFFFISCVGTVLGYLPWLSVVLNSFKREGVTGKVELSDVNFSNLISWAFSVNLKWSKYIPIILFALALLILIINLRKNTKSYNLFMLFMAFLMPVTYVICLLVASSNKHFWDNRYILCSLASFWLFMFVVLVRKNKYAFIFMTVLISLTVMTEYRSSRNDQIATNAYIEEANIVLNQIRNEEEILYDFDTFNVFYSGYLPGVKFTWINDYDYNPAAGKDYIYWISWREPYLDNGNLFSNVIEVEKCGVMRLALGVENVTLYKLEFENHNFISGY